jgi:hypothetical protein
MATIGRALRPLGIVLITCTRGTIALSIINTESQVRLAGSGRDHLWFRPDGFDRAHE